VNVSSLKLFFFLLSTIGPIWGEMGWAQGSFLIHELNSGVDLSELGEVAIREESLELPSGIRGRFTCRAEHGGAVLLSSSNRMFFQFRGPGQFSVERFEQTEPEPAAWRSGGQEGGQSRMLFSLRSGHLILDSRQLDDASRVAVETPLGRITSGRALWQMRIAFDQRSGIFDFEIACSEGRLDFSDERDVQYLLRAGQRLSGAGGWMNPGIEVVEMTGNDREMIAGFLAAKAGSMADAGVLKSYLPFIEDLADTRGFADLPPEPLPNAREVRPVIIEYAPRPERFTPFRGKIPEPSARRAGIF
jgi:hypothetical protein